jgi:Flp pilus assembly protein TadG
MMKLAGGRDHHNKPDGSCGVASKQRERGEVTVQAIFIVPLIMLTMFAIVQYSVAWYAKAALNAAAEDGLRAAQTSADANPTPAAQASITTNARFVSGITITPTTPTPGQLTVTVTGNVAGAFPGLTWTITGRASGPLETFRSQGNP